MDLCIIDMVEVNSAQLIDCFEVGNASIKYQIYAFKPTDTVLILKFTRKTFVNRGLLGIISPEFCLINRKNRRKSMYIRPSILELLEFLMQYPK